MEQYNEKQFVNIGSGEDISIKELAELIKHIIGFKGNLVFDSSKPDGTPRKLMDVTQLKQLGWTYTTSLENGIQQAYDDFLKRGLG